MNRLTRKSENNAIHDYEPTEYGNDLDRIDLLGEYEDLEEQGLLIKLPCKVGTTIYVLDEKGNIRKCRVYNVTTNIYANTIKDNPYWIGFEIKDNSFGKIVFLTREEAEKALEAPNGE